jgi:hypothetical protein
VLLAATTRFVLGSMLAVEEERRERAGDMLVVGVLWG